MSERPRTSQKREVIPTLIKFASKNGDKRNLNVGEVVHVYHANNDERVSVVVRDMSEMRIEVRESRYSFAAHQWIVGTEGKVEFTGSRHGESDEPYPGNVSISEDFTSISGPEGKILVDLSEFR